MKVERMDVGKERREGGSKREVGREIKRGR